MSATTDLLIKNLAETIVENHNKKPSAYDTQAEVRRVEGDIAWVHIPGGVDETPVQLTTNAKKGDIVQVRVSGGRAWLYGNQTAPPTDDTVAKVAQKTAAVADEHAVSAVTSAMLAQEFAEVARDSADEAQSLATQAKDVTDQIVEYADTAEKSVTEILEDAVIARESADSAYNSANLAIAQLGIVENIVGVLDLVSENGVYALTEDPEIKQNKWYFEVVGTAVSDPSGNPHQKGWYELSNGVYSLSDDTTVTFGKTYYTIVASPVSLPVIEDIGSYYELVDIDSAIQNYVSSHLAFANGVLYLQNGETRVSLSTDPDEGLIFENNGQRVAQYGTEAIIGDPRGFHITITANYNNTNEPRISFYRDRNWEVAYISEDKLYITRSVVLQQMDVGDEKGQWSWKIHVIDGRNNLYLKWLG